MDFHITCPKGFANPDAGIKEIRTGVNIVPPGIDNLNRLAFGSERVLRFKQSVFPNKMQEFFLHHQ
jgi:hypothetical protein